MSGPLEDIRQLLSRVDAEQLSLVAREVVLAVGMTPEVSIDLPGGDENGSWESCYRRGLKRMSESLEVLPKAA